MCAGLATALAPAVRMPRARRFATVRLAGPETEMTVAEQLAFSLKKVGADRFDVPDELEMPKVVTPSTAISAGTDVFGNPINADGSPYTAGDSLEVLEEVPPTVYGESDFNGSEWKIGILWNGKKKIDVSWIRCKPMNELQWGFGAEGKWRLEDGTFVTFTRDFFLGWHGRRLFSAKIGEDSNYLEGVVRGWKPWDSATVMGQWEAIRLGVDRPEEAPWTNLEEQLEDRRLQEEAFARELADAAAEQSQADAVRALAADEEDGDADPAAVAAEEETSADAAAP